MPVTSAPRAIVAAAVIAASLVSAGVSWAAELRGTPRIADGDTVTLNGVKVRLHGIDAPETDQVCLDAKGAKWACGITARDALQARYGGKAMTCETREADRYGRQVAKCAVGGEDVERWMVREGWALAFVRYSRDYEADEAAAKAGRKGLWSGAFVAPWDWRARNKDTVILGAVAVPVAARAALMGTAADVGAPSGGCSIKGNVSRKGDRIFHVAGQRDYAKVNMDKGNGERWFCSEADAEAAGWRKAKR